MIEFRTNNSPISDRPKVRDPRGLATYGELENFIERAVILTTGSELQSPFAELAVSVNGGDHGGDRQPEAAGAAATAPRPVTLEDAGCAHIEEIVSQGLCPLVLGRRPNEGHSP